MFGNCATRAYFLYHRAVFPHLNPQVCDTKLHAPQQQGDTYELNTRYQDAANVDSQTCCNKILEALIDSRTLKKRCALVARAEIQ